MYLNHWISFHDDKIRLCEKHIFLKLKKYSSPELLDDYIVLVGIEYIL